jgi:DNA primase
MAGKIPREFIDDLLVRVDLVDLIDSHVPLKKSGSNYMARCPFHNEKSPSFSVNRSKQFYHCFGCGVSGNAISFLMDFSHLNFVEAVEELASFAGVDVPREQSGNAPNQVKPDNLKQLYQLLEQVAKFYAQQFRFDPEAQKAIAYLKNRGLTGQVAKDFMLGYAADKWQNLSAHFPNNLLLEAGLLVTSDSGKQYDRFRGRVMFPIRDKRGRVIGFGGRVLDDSLPKYLNSPETTVFSKGQQVYGLYELLKKNSKPERVLIVEGYMDVIALAQYGISYAVATLGTATSKTHLDLLFRFSSELVLCFDGDNAGRQAAWRAVSVALPCLRDGRQVRIMLLPQGHDPDSLVRAEGVDNFVQRIIHAQALSDYFFTHFTTALDLTTMEGRAKLVSEAKPHLEQLPDGVFKEMMITQLKKLAEVPTLVFPENPTTLSVNPALPKNGTKKHLSPARVAIALLLQNPHLAERVKDQIPQWDNLDFPGLAVLKNILLTILSHKTMNTGVLIEMYRGLAEEKMLKTLASYEFLFPEAGIAEEFLGAVHKIVSQARQAKLNELLRKSNIQELSIKEKDLLKNMLQSKY